MTKFTRISAGALLAAATISIFAAAPANAGVADASAAAVRSAVTDARDAAQRLQSGTQRSTYVVQQRGESR